MAAGQIVNDSSDGRIEPFRCRFASIMFNQLKLSQKMLILVAVPLLFEFAFIMALNQLLDQAEKERQRESVARRIISHVNSVHRVLLDSGSASLGFSLTTDPVAREQRKKDLQEQLSSENRALQKLLVDKPEARAHFEKAEKLITEASAEMKLMKRLFRQEGILAVRDKLKTVFGKLSDQLDSILEEERQAELSSPKVQAEQREKIQQLLLVGVVLNTVIAIGSVLFLTRGVTGRLVLLMDNTVRLARGLPLNPPLKGNDELTHLDATFREMAFALAIASMKERAVVEYSADMIFSITRSGKLEQVSRACIALLGYAPEELIDQHYLQFVVREEREATVKALEDSRAANASGSFENGMIRKDGSIVSTLWSVTWSDADETFFCVAHDITARKEVERLKRDFVSMVSHDLRTPLTSVQSYLELLSDGIYGELNTSGKARLTDLSISIDRLVKLICDLLDLDRLESGSLNLRLQKQSIGSMIDQMQSACMALKNEKNVSVEVEKVDLNINADGDRLVQVLVNLVSNAIKFSPSGETVSVTVTSENGVVEFRVQDRGCGIPEQFQRTIFDRFKQAPEGEEIKGGTGLGLAISKAIVEQHGGEIGVESAEGRGSVFWFTLPNLITS